MFYSIHMLERYTAIKDYLRKACNKEESLCFDYKWENMCI